MITGKRIKTVSIRLSEENYQQLKKQAEVDYKTVTAYVRYLIINKLNNYIDPCVTDMQFYPKALLKKEIKKSYKK